MKSLLLFITFTIVSLASQELYCLEQETQMYRNLYVAEMSEAMGDHEVRQDYFNQAKIHFYSIIEYECHQYLEEQRASDAMRDAYKQWGV